MLAAEVCRDSLRRSTQPCRPEEEPEMGPSEALFIAQVVVLLLVGRLLGEAMQRASPA